MFYDDNSLQLHRARAEHRCSRCNSIIRIGEKVAYQKAPYVDIPHERIHPATPQEDGHIEAMNSIIGRELIRRFEFDSLEDAKNIIDRYMMFYNSERIHSAIKYKTPKEMYEKCMEKSQKA